MDPKLEAEEKLREAACVGDIESVQKLIESLIVDVNSQNKSNGWTALHWSAKRNHSSIVSYLLLHGADKDLKNKDGETAAQLTTSIDIRNMLGYNDMNDVKHSELPIKPNYLANPKFPYTQPVLPNNSGPEHSLHSRDTKNSRTTNDENELVLKLRLANADERDFIEIELDKNSLTYDALLGLACRELCVERNLVHKVRKLPDTIVRKDKDVQRLRDFQELELVLSNKVISASSRSYGLTGAMTSKQILY